MKKLITILLLLFTVVINAQNETEKVDTKQKEEIISAPMLICSNEDRDKWFAILPIVKKSNDIVIKTYFRTLKLNIGKCSKNDVLVFTFEDGRKIRISANNEMNCDVTELNEFVLNSIDYAFLETKTLESIRYINGNDSTSFVYTMTKENKNFFVNIFPNFKK